MRHLIETERLILKPTDLDDAEFILELLNIPKSDKKKIGTCGLYDREGLEGVDIGFGFLPEFEQKGYAFESALKVKQLAKDKFNLKQINAITSQMNVSSQKLLEKLGLEYKKLIKLPNSEEELMFFQIDL